MTDTNQLDPWTQALIASQNPGPDNTGPVQPNLTPRPGPGFMERLGGRGVDSAPMQRPITPALGGGPGNVTDSRGYTGVPTPAAAPAAANNGFGGVFGSGMSYADLVKYYHSLFGGGGNATAVHPAARPPVAAPTPTPGTSLSGVGGNAAAVPRNIGGGGGSMVGTPNMNDAVLGGQIMGDPTLGAGGGAAASRLAQQPAQGPPNNVTSFMGGPPITTGNPFGFYSPTTGNARGATWNPPTAPPSYNMGYGGGGGAPAPATSGGGGGNRAPATAHNVGANPDRFWSVFNPGVNANDLGLAAGPKASAVSRFVHPFSPGVNANDLGLAAGPNASPLSRFWHPFSPGVGF